MSITIKEWGYLENPYLQDPYLETLVYGQMAVQFQAVATFSMAVQFRAVLYNAKQLRMMCEFASRGQVGTGGTNAWGNNKGEGLNWVSTSTEAGDFSPNNLNTDIVEQVWRSATGVVTSIILRCDTEIEQGVFLDTIAILNHNLTSSATVLLQGSTSATFGTVGISISMQVTPDNMYWISPELPNNGYRYWRLVIDDPTNDDGFVSIGTVVFGVADIFTSGAFQDAITFGYKDFADSIETEGFTNVANSRALKRVLSLNFPVQDAFSSNFAVIRNLLREYRSTHKCLIIPTPSATDQRITDQFAVFSKVVPPLPTWVTNYKSDTNQYADIQISWDESR